MRQANRQKRRKEARKYPAFCKSASSEKPEVDGSSAGDVYPLVASGAIVCGGLIAGFLPQAVLISPSTYSAKRDFRDAPSDLARDIFREIVGVKHLQCTRH